jgi:hypothetical protein
VPLLSGLLALLLFRSLARRFQPPWVAALSVGIFVLAPTLIAHGAEFKPYSTDLLASVWLTTAAFAVTERGAAWPAWLGAIVLGTALPWFSDGAAFVVAGLGAALLGVRSLKERFARPVSLIERPDPIVLAPGFDGWLAVTLAFWTVSAGAAAWAATQRVPPEMREYLNRFWQPSLPRWPLLVFIAVAAVLLWLRDRRGALILLGPVAVTLAASAVHLYPFSGRAILFLTPAAILALAEAGSWIVGGLARGSVPRWLGAAIPALAVGVPIALHPPVYRNEDVRPVLERLGDDRQEHDAIYVVYSGRPAFRFYAPRIGISDVGVVTGGCHRDDPRGYLRELDKLRGTGRVWVFRTHVSERLAEAPLFDGYLSRIGRYLDSIAGEDTDATLWDLSRTDAPADLAETYPLPPRDTALANRFGCGHGPIGPIPVGWE